MLASEHAFLRATTCSVTKLIAADIVHCSVTPDSIILSAADGQTCVKLTGFESSQTCGKTECLNRHIPASSYTAREVHNGKYTAAADLWALGWVVYWLLSGEEPSGLDSGELYHQHHL